MIDPSSNAIVKVLKFAAHCQQRVADFGHELSIGRSGICLALSVMELIEAVSHKRDGFPKSTVKRVVIGTRFIPTNARRAKEIAPR